MKYRALPLSETSVVELADGVNKELGQVEQAFAEQDFVQLTETFVEPTRLRDGLTVFADGTEWNPGSGRGVYTYYGSAWHKLG